MERNRVSDSSSSDSGHYKEFLLPPAVVDHEQSVKFLGCCLVASTSIILHYRKLLPPERFAKMAVHKLLSWILRSDDPVGCNIVLKLKAVQEAISQGYVKEFMLVVCDDRANPDSVVELYTWEFSYLKSGVPTAKFVDCNGKRVVEVSYRGYDHIKNQLKILLPKIRNLCKFVLSDLDKNCYPGLRVTYTEKRPADYVIPGFYNSDVLYMLHDDVRPVPFKDGGMATKFHGAFVTVNSAFVLEKEEDEIFECINKGRFPAKETGTSFSDTNVIPELQGKGVEKTISSDSNLFDAYDDEEGFEVTRAALQTDSDEMMQKIQPDRDILLEATTKVSSVIPNTTTNESFSDETSLLATYSVSSRRSLDSSQVSALQAETNENAKRKAATSSMDTPVKRTRVQREQRKPRKRVVESDSSVSPKPVKSQPLRRGKRTRR